MKKIIIDVDGVIKNLHGALIEPMREIHPTFEENNIKSWNFDELDIFDKRLKPEILRLFGDKDFIKNAKVYDGAIEALIEIDEIAFKYGYQVEIHTHVFNNEIKEDREVWLNDIKNKNNSHFNIKVTVGRDKEMEKNVAIIVEDNVKNLINANADMSILIRRCHNRFEKIKDIETKNNLVISDSLSNAKDIIIGYIKNNPLGEDILDRFVFSSEKNLSIDGLKMFSITIKNKDNENYPIDTYINVFKAIRPDVTTNKEDKENDLLYSSSFLENIAIFTILERKNNEK